MVGGVRARVGCRTSHRCCGSLRHMLCESSTQRGSSRCKCPRYGRECAVRVQLRAGVVDAHSSGPRPRDQRVQARSPGTETALPSPGLLAENRARKICARCIRAHVAGVPRSSASRSARRRRVRCFTFRGRIDAQTRTNADEEAASIRKDNHRGWGGRRPRRPRRGAVSATRPTILTEPRRSCALRPRRAAGSERCHSPDPEHTRRSQLGIPAGASVSPPLSVTRGETAQCSPPRLKERRSGVIETRATSPAPYPRTANSDPGTPP
ncbi:hypothetical protein SAMN04487848_0428 [Microbacterium sp. ru370.1]|nr:hypothetical protein SAMN04487848_0428 [Microbacterium sp. ru370.1]SIT76975.1 hypothetical protein SAMN05880579_0423 [Microbacterium sp. RU1D]